MLEIKINKGKEKGSNREKREKEIKEQRTKE